jgi:hypothetical protein
VPAHPHAPAAVTTHGNRVFGRRQRSHGPRVGESTRRRVAVSASMSTVGRTTRSTCNTRAQQHHAKIRGSRTTFVVHAAPQPASLPPGAHGRRRRCSQTHDTAMTTHARDAFKHSDVHEQDTVMAMASPAADTTQQHAAPTPAASPLQLPRAECRHPRHAAIVLFDVPQRGTFQTRPPACTRCMG